MTVKKNKNELVVTQDNYNSLELAKQIQKIELKIKELKDAQDKYKSEIKQFMEENGVTSIENDYMKITYQAESEKVTLDTTMVKKEFTEVYVKCSKKMKTSSFIKIAIK